MYYLLYEITNLINGKTYIGQHITQNINDGYMGSGHAIVKAIKKYGKENFKKEILLNAKNEIALNFFEKALVTPEFIELNTNYNLKEGGGGSGKLSKATKSKLSAIRKGKKKSPEHIAKISAAHKGKKMPPRTPEQIAKMSLYLKGIKKSPLSSEHKAKISATKRGRKLPPETRAKMSETHKKIWESRKIAAQ